MTDIFVDFIRQQLAWSDLADLCHLSLHKVDFSEANSLTLHKLLAPMAKKIEFLEVCPPRPRIQKTATDDPVLRDEGRQSD